MQAVPRHAWAWASRDETKSFLRAARRYCSFIELTAKADAEFLEELELVLLELYKQATTLRSATLQHNINFDDRRSDDESARILHEIAKKLGAARHYWEVFDPWTMKTPTLSARSAG